MSTEDHLISPPDELLEDWWQETQKVKPEHWVRYLADRAAHWGYKQGCVINEVELRVKLQKARDEELEACCEQMKSIPSPLGIPFGEMASNALRSARRPTPKSLAEQKQAIHDEIHQLLAQISASNAGALAVAEPIRRALERLRELEEGDE